MSLKVWIDERPAYKRSFGDGKMIKFTITSEVVWLDGKTTVFDTTGDKHLIDVFKDHVLDLYDIDIDCSYLMDHSNYQNLVIPWAYSQKSVREVLDIEQLEPETSGLTTAQLELENRKVKEIIDFLHNNILLEKSYSTLQN